MCFAFQVLDALLCSLVHICQFLIHLLRLLFNLLLLLLTIDQLLGRWLFSLANKAATAAYHRLLGLLLQSVDQFLGITARHCDMKGVPNGRFIAWLKQKNG